MGVGVGEDGTGVAVGSGFAVGVAGRVVAVGTGEGTVVWLGRAGVSAGAAGEAEREHATAPVSMATIAKAKAALESSIFTEENEARVQSPGRCPKSHL
jgi:hypothetical protein